MPTLEQFRSTRPDALIIPARHVFMITPNDSADLPHVTRRVVVTGTAGNVQVQMEGDTAPQTVAVLAGEVLDWSAVRIFSTNTTATGLRGEA
jgi:hypothetical protein